MSAVDLQLCTRQLVSSDSKLAEILYWTANFRSSGLVTAPPLHCDRCAINGLDTDQQIATDTVGQSTYVGRDFLASASVRP